VPGLRHPQREEVLPHVQTELPMLQFVPLVLSLGTTEESFKQGLQVTSAACCRRSARTLVQTQRLSSLAVSGMELRPASAGSRILSAPCQQPAALQALPLSLLLPLPGKCRGFVQKLVPGGDKEFQKQDSAAV